MIPYSICVSFIFAALPSVIQTVTFLKAAGSIRPAQRLQWKPRGPVVKETLSSNMATSTHAYTHTDRDTCNWQTREEVSSHASQMFFLKSSATKIEDWSIRQTAFSLLLLPKEAAVRHQLIPVLFFFSLVFSSRLPLRRLLRDVLRSVRL